MEKLTIVAIIGAVVATVLFQLFSGWLFYFAPCSTVKKYLPVVRTPGRCLVPGVNASYGKNEESGGLGLKKDSFVKITW